MKRKQDETQANPKEQDFLESKKIDTCKYKEGFSRAASSIASVISDLKDMNIEIGKSVCAIVEYENDLKKTKEDLILLKEANEQAIKNYVSILGFSIEGEDNG